MNTKPSKKEPWETPVLLPLDLSKAAGGVNFGDEPVFTGLDIDGDFGS